MENVMFLMALTASLVARRINCVLQLHALLSLFTANKFFFFFFLFVCV